MTEKYKYRVGGSLPINAPTYVTRQADQDFYEGLNAGTFCYVLNARQTGKSSLLWRTKNRLEGVGVQCAVIDLSSIGRYQMTSDKWYATLIRKLVNDFGFTNEFDQSTWWTDREQLSPIYRFSEFIETVLLANVKGQIVIFLDEIDSVLRFEFKDDFFTAIRAFFNKRAENSEYNRLTFSLLGVATPTDLIEDKEQTPFNIGQAIELTGFQSNEVQPLTQGLIGKVAKPQEALEEILQWTGGHPFLTQKLCSLLLQQSGSLTSSESITSSIENLVSSQIIDNWEAHDYPEHLKTIRNRLIANEQRAGRLLGLYQYILNHQDERIEGHETTAESPNLNNSRSPSHTPNFQSPGIVANSHPDQMALRLTGLVIKQQGRLKVYNRIYASIFDQAWINRELSNLRPYSEALNIWIESGYKDESRLLRGVALKEAQEWVSDKNLDKLDYQFLDASVEKNFEAERQVNQILLTANQRATKRVRVGSIILGASFLATAILGIAASNLAGKARYEAKIASDAETKFKVLSAENTSLNNQSQKIKLSLEQSKEEKELAKSQAKEARKQAKAARNSAQVSEASEKAAKAETKIAQDISKNAGAAAQAARVKEDEARASAEKAVKQRQQAESAKTAADTARKLTEDLEKLERDSNAILATFEKDSRSQLDTLLLAVESGKSLQKLLIKSRENLQNLPGSQPSEQYPTPSSVLALQAILDNIQEVQRFNHEEWIWCVSFSPDGKRLAIASRDRKLYVRALSPDSGLEEEVTLKGHNGEILSVQFNPKNNNQIATASSDGTVRLWNVETRQSIVLSTENQGKVLSVDFSPDGRQVAAAGDGGKVRVWNVESKQLTASFEAHSDRIFKLSFDPSDEGGRRIATAGLDGTARIWDLETGQQTAEFKHKGIVLAVSFSPDGKQLATAGDNGSVHLWDIESNREIATEPRAHLGWVMSVHFSPDGKQLATTGLDFAAKVWDVSKVSGKVSSISKVSEFKHRGVVTDARFSPDGKQLATTGLDQTTRLWKLSEKESIEPTRENTFITRVVFSPDPDKENLMARVGSDGMVQLLDVGSKPQQIVKKFVGHQGWVTSVSFDSTGKRLATADVKREVRIWDVESGREISVLPQQSDSKETLVNSSVGKLPGVSNVVFSPDGKQLAIAYLGGMVRLWNIELQHEMFQFRADRALVGSMSFSPDGTFLATTGIEGKVQLWNTRENKRVDTAIFKATKRRVLNVSFSPKLDNRNRSIIALATSDGLVQLGSLNSNKSLDPIKEISEFSAHPGVVLRVIFSPDGNRVATVGLDGAIRVWAVASLIASKEPNDNRIATLGLNGAIRAWAVASLIASKEKAGQQLAPQIAEFKTKGRLVLNISFSASGNQLATVEADGYKFDGSPVSSEVRQLKIESLDQLIVRGCNWLKDYSEAQDTCKDVRSQK